MASDPFNRANESPLASPWIADSVFNGAMVLVSNHVEGGTYGDDALVYRTDSAAASSQVTYLGDWGNYCGPAINCNGAGNFYLYRADGRAFRVDAGSLSDLAYDFIAANPSDTLRIRRVGSNVVCAFNGVDAFSGTDVTHTGGYDGFYSYDGGGDLLDDWTNGAGGGSATSLPIVRRMARMSPHFR